MLRLSVDEFSKLITEISVSSRDEALCKEITACTWQKEKKFQMVVSFVFMFILYSYGSQLVFGEIIWLPIATVFLPWSPLKKKCTARDF